MLLCGAVMIIADAAAALYVLNRIYNLEFRTQLYLRGHIFVMALYIGVFIFLGRVFGGLLVGVRRNGEVMFSFAFTCIMADAFFYIVVTLLSYKFPDPVPLLAVLVLQMCFSLAWIGITGVIYFRLFRPMDVLLIYSGRSIENFLPKLSTRKDQFHVIRSVGADTDIEKLRGLIAGFDTVMLWDIPSERRNVIFKFCYENSKRIYVMPKISDIILNGSTPVNLFDTPLLLTEGSPLEYEERVIKRTMDIVMSLCLIVLTSPVMLITALAIKIEDRGPVFYRQVRCTKNRRRFRILKFRSMVVDAEKAGVAVLAMKEDPRITRVGRFIRKCRIDELPQLFNVLIGDMSFVGPRPERPEFIERFEKDMPEFAYRMKVRAGITGFAQLYGKYNTLPYDKLKFDLYYMEQYSLWLDIKLIILTLKILFMEESTEGAAEEVTAASADNTDDDGEKS